MKILDRYMLRSLLVPLVYCLAAFSMLFVIWDLFERLSKFIDAETPVVLVAFYYLALLLPAFEYLAPACLMLGTLYALWQLTRTNELMAMQASGVSLSRVLWPYLGVGLAFTIALGVIKETVGARAFVWTEKFREAKFQVGAPPLPGPLAYYDMRTHRLWLADKFLESEPGYLEGVKITQERPNGKRMYDVVAGRAEYLDGAWWLHSPSEQRYDEADNPVGGLTPVSKLPNHVQERRDLSERPVSLAIESRNWLFLSTREMIRYLREHPEISKESARQKRYDIHSRLAMPWACLVVTLFAIPTGAKTGRQSPLTGIFVAVGFFFGYYFLSQVGLMLGKSGALQPWLGAWLSNIVFLVSGLVMLLRMR